MTNKPRRGLPLGIILALTLVSTCVSTPVGCAYIGQRRATRLCDETEIGSNVADFRARARRDMDHVFDTADRRDVLADDSGTASGPKSKEGGQVSAMAVGFVFLRYFCIVDYDGQGVIVSKRLSSLD